jgi:hypothetical protein
MGIHKMEFILKNLDKDALNDIFWSMMTNTDDKRIQPVDNAVVDADKTPREKPKMNWTIPKLTMEQWIFVCIFGGLLFYVLYRILLYVFIGIVLYYIWSKLTSSSS